MDEIEVAEVPGLGSGVHTKFGSRGLGVKVGHGVGHTIGGGQKVSVPQANLTNLIRPRVGRHPNERVRVSVIDRHEEEAM